MKVKFNPQTVHLHGNFQVHLTTSKSEPGVYHITCIGDTGFNVCSCRGYQFSKYDPKTCTHIKEITNG